MDFTNTQYGKTICDLGIRALTKYTQKTEQYAIQSHITDISKDINLELDQGSRFIDMKLLKDCTFIVIFERDKK